MNMDYLLLIKFYEFQLNCWGWIRFGKKYVLENENKNEVVGMFHEIMEKKR